MDRGLRDKWCEALRSGKYKQGRTRLKNEHGEYCCLGVLTEVSGVPGHWEDTSNGTYWVDPEGNYYSAYPPDIDGDTLGSLQASRLVKLNDSERLTFPQIADWIEENL